MTSIRAIALAAVAACVTTGMVAFGAGAPGGDGRLLKSAVFQWDGLAPRTTSIGARREVMRTPTATLDELESHITTLNANQSPHAPHQHPNEELLVLKEGSVEAYVNGEWVPVRTGGIMFFASNAPHTVRNVSDSPATYYVFNWSPPGLLEKKGTSAQ